MVRRQSTLFSPVPSPSHLCSVYSESDDHAHSHHEILLTSFPLALEWMDFDPEQPDKKGQPYVIRLSSCSQFSTMAPVFSTLHNGSSVLNSPQWLQCSRPSTMAVITLSTCRVYCSGGLQTGPPMSHYVKIVFVTLQATTLLWAPCVALKCGTLTS